jgi:hypothetical protein
MANFFGRVKSVLRTLFLVAFGFAVASVMVVSLADHILHPRVTAMQFLAIVGAVGLVALYAVISGQEAPTTDEKPFRSRHIGGIEVHYYRDGTRVVYNEDSLVSYEAGTRTVDDNDGGDGGDDFDNEPVTPTGRRSNRT